MPCSRCNSRSYIKKGFAFGNQRYRCKKCGYQYSVKSKSTSYPKKTKKLALDMYLEGMGLRAIGRILKVSHVSVGNWIEEFGEKLTQAQKRR